MTVKIGISLPDETHARARAVAAADGLTMSGLIHEALRAEISRRELEDHARMVREATDTTALRHRAEHRRGALRRWKDNQG